MNKYQEALDNLYRRSTDTHFYIPMGEDKLWKNTLQELVDKETPKKLVRFIDKFYVSPYKCPVCKTIPHTCTQKYCGECSQKLDWGIVMKNDEKWFIHRIVFPDNLKKEPEVIKHENFEKYTIEQNIGVEIIENYEKWLIDFLYEQYAKEDVHTLFVLNKTQFKDFLLKYLPKYMEELNDEL